jgi:hypothetical protein
MARGGDVLTSAGRWRLAAVLFLAAAAVRAHREALARAYINGSVDAAQNILRTVPNLTTRSSS